MFLTSFNKHETPTNIQNCIYVVCHFHLRTKLLDDYKSGVWCNTSRTSTIFYIC